MIPRFALLAPGRACARHRRGGDAGGAIRPAPRRRAARTAERLERLVRGCTVRGGGSSNSSSSAVTVKAVTRRSARSSSTRTWKTLYLFEADSMNKSNRSGGCLSLWPPVMANGQATAGSGVTAGMIGTATDSSQVTYAGHPLYWFSADTKAGDTNGEGLTDFGGAWYAISPAGKAVEG